MGIDGIGGGPGGIGGPGGVGGPKGPPKAQSFQVEKPEAAGASQDVAGADLDRLERGELSLDEYLDVRAEQAVAHLQQLSPEQLQIIKSQVVEQLKNDPALMRLVQRATGVSVPEGE